MSETEDPKKHYFVGKKVIYTPAQIEEDKPCEGEVTLYMTAGEIFNQDMLCIDTVNHWIPASECRLKKP